MDIELHDGGLYEQLLPLTFTRPVGALRVGIFTIAEVWRERAGLGVTFSTEGHLRQLFPSSADQKVLCVLAGALPTASLVEAVLDLLPGQVLVHNGRPLAFCVEGEGKPGPADWVSPPAFFKKVELTHAPTTIERPWHLFQYCGVAIEADLELVANGTPATLSNTNTVIGDPAKVLLAPGAKVEASTFNTENGAIYIGPDAEVMEGCLVRGPFALGARAQLKMGAKIYGPTAIGPHSRIGGEVNNCVVQGYSNKGHDGFLGNSVLGEWCNLGADTNNSNLKNNYGPVRMWSYADGAMVDTGLQFCGLVMGDHSKCGINTMLNTGTIVGVCANIFGHGFPPKHVPSFSWGVGAKAVEHELEKALATAEKVMARRKVNMTEADREVLRHVLARSGRPE